MIRVLFLAGALLASGPCLPRGAPPTKISDVRGPDGLTVVSYEWGNPDGPETGQVADGLNNTVARDPDVFLQGTKDLLEVLVATPGTPREFEKALAYNMLCPRYVRDYANGLPAEVDSGLAGITVPVLAINGGRDRLMSSAMSKYAAERVRNGTLLIYENSGHPPFYEEADRFNADLRRFVAATRH